MINYCCDRPSKLDLAGQVYETPSYWQTQPRIEYLVKSYLSVNKLCDRLEDFPIQFTCPHFLKEFESAFQQETLNSII